MGEKFKHSVLAGPSKPANERICLQRRMFVGASHWVARCSEKVLLLDGRAAPERWFVDVTGI